MNSQLTNVWGSWLDEEACAERSSYDLDLFVWEGTTPGDLSCIHEMVDKISALKHCDVSVLPVQTTIWAAYIYLGMEHGELIC